MMHGVPRRDPCMQKVPEVNSEAGSLSNVQKVLRSSLVRRPRSSSAEPLIQLAIFQAFIIVRVVGDTRKFAMVVQTLIIEAFENPEYSCIAFEEFKLIPCTISFR